MPAPPLAPTLFQPELPPPRRYVRVLPERGMDRSPAGLTYAAPFELPDVEIGDRVRIPLGRGDKPTWGFVVDRIEQPDVDPARVKRIQEVDPAGPMLSPQLLDLGRWIASYYCCPVGMALATMLPAAVKKGTGSVVRMFVDLSNAGAAALDDERGAAVAVMNDETETRVTATALSASAKCGSSITEASEHVRLTKLQRGLLAAIRDAPARPADPRDIIAAAGAKTQGPLNRLVELGLVIRTPRRRVEALWDQCIDDAREALPSIRLTDAQRSVRDAIAATLDHGFSVHVIHGVTGSGKTEVYLLLIERVRAAGKCAIVLVPEISLTPQTVARFRARFGDEVAILHSGLTAAQRHAEWSRVRERRASVIVGARSAVFAPIADDRLGLIIVDEEHDGAYKQDQAPRYHGRDVAVKRAQLAGATVVLGSATPSLESYHNARARGLYHWHELAERVPGARMPHVTIVDLAEERRARGSRDKRVHLLGPQLENALRHTLDTGGQAMLLLNRRGYANYICCPDHNCGWVMSCDDCDAAMVYHKDGALPRGGFVRCHHCEGEQTLPANCPVCGRRVNTFGLGTQRIEEELARKFPDLIEGETLIRMDSDSMRGARSYHLALDGFRRGMVRVIVGTQMIAKGLDFPNVRLVGVVNADTAINLPDFRAAERTFQLVAQVAGRAGRGVEPGRVFVQTFQPQLPAIQFAAKHDYIGFADREMRERSRAMLPPLGRMARIVVRDEEYAAAVRRVAQIASRLRELLNEGECVAMADRAARGSALAHASPGDRRAATGSTRAPAPSRSPLWVRGPAPCPLSRIGGYHRQSVEILSAIGPAPIQRLLTALRNEGLVKSDAATAVDVDPIDLL